MSHVTIITLIYIYIYIVSIQQSYKHTKSFRHQKHRNETELSKLIWRLKDENKDYTLSWSIAKRSSPYRLGSKRCDLCLTEKVAIIRANPKGLLNKRTELISKCRHRNKFLLK